MPILPDYRFYSIYLIQIYTLDYMSTEDKAELKVSDIVMNFSQNDYENTAKILKELNSLQAEYSNLEDRATPERLEEIKRQMGSYLSSLATFYSKIRCFKSNHEYLEEARKQIKSDAILLIMKRDGLTTASAEKIVYSEEFYKSRVDLLQQLKRFFYLVELKYDRFKETLRDIYQSVSQLSEERRRSNGI